LRLLLFSTFYHRLAPVDTHIPLLRSFADFTLLSLKQHSSASQF